MISMRRLAVFSLICVACGAQAALTESDEAALRQLAKDYVSWDYTGRPIQFRDRLDYDSYAEQRQILTRLAENPSNGFWRDYWRKRGVQDVGSLRGMSPQEFWQRYHSGLQPLPHWAVKPVAGRVSAEIHAMTEARGMAYVVYQVHRASGNLRHELPLQVLRARRVEGEWRLVAFPEVTAFLRTQLTRPTQKMHKEEE